MEGLLAQAGELTILVSSHELGEIDGVATHVAFLDEGKLLFEESMSDVSARFREVRVTLEREASAPGRVPENWLQVRAVGNVLSFVETRFSEEAFTERVKSLLAGVRTIDTQPMGLRSIFTALARSARDGAA
jgi:ABC-2 type transport system ATP-binding protein